MVFGAREMWYMNSYAFEPDAQAHIRVTSKIPVSVEILHRLKIIKQPFHWLVEDVGVNPSFGCLLT